MRLNDIAIEPFFHEIELPVLNPVNKIIRKVKQKEDGAFAKLSCDKGENTLKYYIEMSRFFSKK